MRLAFGIAAGVGVALSAAVASGRGILVGRWWLLAALGLWAVVWVIAVVAGLRLPEGWAVGAIVVAGMALRVAALAGPPATSDDLYRYSWDGRVQAAGIDPYRSPPDSPALLGRREAWLWPPPAGCAALHRPAGCTRINRPAVRTIYPPAAEAWFAAAYRLGGPEARHKTWQVAGLVTELGVLGLLPITLRRWGRDVRWVVLYALSPAPVLEFVNNGHVDGLAVVCLVGALGVLAGRPRPGRDVAFGLLVGAAALVKLYPAVAVFAAGGAAGATWRSTARAAVSAGVLSIGAYLPHVLRVGVHVLGYLPGYLREERYTTGGRFLLASAAHVPHPVAGLLTAAAAVAAVAWVAATRPDPPAGVAVMLGVLVLAASPVQPWYAVTLLACATIAARPAWSLVVAAGYPYFFAVILADRHAVFIGEVAYATACAAMVLAAVHAARGSGGAVNAPALTTSRG